MVSSVLKLTELENVRLETSSHQSLLEHHFRRRTIKILLVSKAEV